jgi:putative ABC transport system permease protein
MPANGNATEMAKDFMGGSVETIPIWNLAVGLLPAVVVLVIIYRWELEVRTAIWALVRMLVQLFAVGYVLVHIFQTDNAWLILAVLLLMLSAASWIALGPIRPHRPKLYSRAWLSIAVGGGLTLALVTQGVLRLEPWFAPGFIIPLGGMIFANAMNAISISAERFYAETSSGADYTAARQTALRAALIPLTNSLLAVGIVCLPGMMTGQILSGVDPLVAATYQIMVMGMVFGSGGIAAACFLTLLKPDDDRG